MCGIATTVSKRLLSIIIVAAALASTGPALGEDKMVLGPDQFKEDKSGAGAVLCAWSIYLSVQAEAAACALPRRPVDDAMDQAVVAIDEFILANSSLHPSKGALENFKRDVAVSAIAAARRGYGSQFCKREDLEYFRSLSPEKIQTSVKALLAVPREPVMNPCL